MDFLHKTAKKIYHFTEKHKIKVSQNTKFLQNHDI